MIIPNEVSMVRDTVVRAGGRCLLVGGAVVDALLGISPKDWDVEVFGISYEGLETLFEDYHPKTVGRSFGIVKITIGEVEIDLNVPRRDNKVGKGHKDFSCELDPAMTPREAARRRDFSMNSISLDLSTMEVVDPFGGVADLEDGILRATDPETFVEDPLRALRAMQLLARKAKVVDPATMDLIRGMSDTFPHLARERVHDEWCKLLLRAEKPSVGLEFLRESGWLKWFPELAEFADWSGWDLEENAPFRGDFDEGCPHNPEWHPEGNVWIHNCMVVDAAAKVRHLVDEEWRLAFMFGALLHDVGKTITTVLPRCTAHAHDVRGEDLTRSFMARLTNDKTLTERVVALVVNHLQPFMLTSGGAKASAWKRLHKKMLNRLDVLGWLSRSDWAGRPDRDPLAPSENGVEADHPASALCWGWHETLGVEPISPIVMGRDLIAVGMDPGPHMGIALRAAFEAQIENPELGKQELLEQAVRYSEIASLVK
jgi:tRNA nucleotidyltransferase (CCA-adding enzyme)